MTKEIIVNAGELESRVAILENGRLMELHVEREPKIVGNIYKGRVTKVLKGMDAAFIEIGIERNAFLAASDIIPEDDDEGGGGGRGRSRDVPPINTLLKANQIVLAQVARAPMGSKGARVTTRLSLPGRYMVLILNGGTRVGVSRKIEESAERSRLREIGQGLLPEGRSLIVRTEAEGRSEEELRQDLVFLTDMARRIEARAESSTAPALIHGDLTLIFRLIRDAFTRDVSRVVVDSPTAYENVLELVDLIAPGMRNRVFLYDDPMPIFHAYNIEAEIERALRRRVWLPSGGYLIIDQAEALTAIDVNTGRFVGSVDLEETVLTTNLQACEEVARQLRLRDLGGIIVVDFIDMEIGKHRAQVNKAFEEALHHDRAKIKVHSISPLGLVEMTRKRTGESLAGLLTEQCPYCAGIGRVQNALTMALRVERELAASAVEYGLTEAFLVHAHPRVVAAMLGFEGEAHRDLEAFVARPVYYRLEDGYHPNTYRVEHLTHEQALAVVPHIEEGQIVEARVANPDPEVSASPLVTASGIFLMVPDLEAPVGARVRVRVTAVSTSFGAAEVVTEELRAALSVGQTLLSVSPPLVSESILPAYLREERMQQPPRGLPLLSPSAHAVPVPEEIPEYVPAQPRPAPEKERRAKSPRRKKGAAAPEAPVAPPVEIVESQENVIELTVGQTLLSVQPPVEPPFLPVQPPVESPFLPVQPSESVSSVETPAPDETFAEPRSKRRRRRRGRGKGGDSGTSVPPVSPYLSSGDSPAATPELAPAPREEPVGQTLLSAPQPEGEAGDTLAPRHKRRHRGGRRHRKSGAAQSLLPMEDGPGVVSPPSENVVPQPALAPSELGGRRSVGADMTGERHSLEPTPEPKSRATRARKPRAQKTTPAVEPVEAAPVVAQDQLTHEAVTAEPNPGLAEDMPVRKRRSPARKLKPAGEGTPSAAE